MDPTGAAGITADARMVHVRGAFPLPVAACLTVQNRFGFRSCQTIDEDLLQASLAAVLEDGELDGIKLGLLGSTRQLLYLRDLLADFLAGPLVGLPLVVDPVLSATAGGLAPDPAYASAYRELAAQATLMTPNQEELARLAPGGATELLDLGCQAVLVTGGDAGVGGGLQDCLHQRGAQEQETVEYRHPRQAVGPVHGTGCALASAAAVHLASGLVLEEACRLAINDVQVCLAGTSPAADGLPVPLQIV